MKRTRRLQPGFTIVELLIVIVVIAILAAISIVAYNGIQDRARNAAAQSAAIQAKKKLEIYKLGDGNGNYPTTGNLAQAGLSESDGYQYTSNGTTFCVTATTGTKSYKVTDTSDPMQGGCAGHGQGGAPAITNYYTDPKPTGTGTVGAWDGGNTPLAHTNVASTWSSSGRANRLAFPSTISTNNGGPTISLQSSYGPYVGQKYTIVANLRLISGTAGIGSISIDRNGNVGNLSIHASGGGNIASLSTGQTYRVYMTFTGDNTSWSGTNMRFYIQISNKSSNATVEVADIDLYAGDYTNRSWGSGDSLNWIWNGTPNASTSTGPAL